LLDLVLVSKSPRRRDILTSSGFLFSVDTMEVSEIINENINPEAICRHLAQRKVEALRLARNPLKLQNKLLLGVDTIVVLADQVLGKPKNSSEAVQFLNSLSGVTHLVMTGIYVFNGATGESYSGVEVTEVTFKKLSTSDIEGYVQSGDPFDKAGGYGIQGEAKKFVASYKGSYLNVVGLPLEHFERILREKNWNVHRRES
jgi:septum formation protein